MNEASSGEPFSMPVASNGTGITYTRDCCRDTIGYPKGVLTSANAKPTKGYLRIVEGDASSLPLQVRQSQESVLN